MSFPFRPSNLCSSSEDSDSDNDNVIDMRNGNKKIRRLTAPHSSPQTLTSTTSSAEQAKKKNAVWSNVINEEILSEGLSQEVGVRSSDRDLVERASETYDPTHGPLKDTSVSSSANLVRIRDNNNSTVSVPSGSLAMDTELDRMEASSSAPSSSLNFPSGSSNPPPPQQQVTDDSDPFGDDLYSTDIPEKETHKVDSRTNDNKGHDHHKKDDNRYRKRDRYERDNKQRRYYPHGNQSWKNSKEIIHVPPHLELSSEETADTTGEKIGKKMAEGLRENKPELVIRVVVALGVEKALKLYHETREKQQNGGVLTIARDRHRTAGGVFIYLIKEDKGITEEQNKMIFEAEKAANRLFAKARRTKHRAKSFEEQLQEVKAMKEADEKLKATGEKVLKSKEDVILDEAMEKTDDEADKMEELLKEPEEQIEIL